jgi:hypothetical protein
MSSEPIDPSLRDPFPARHSSLVFLRGIGGAIVGGIVGYLIFRVLLSFGFYGLVVPGAMLGLGAGLAARGSSQVLGVLCAIAAFVLTVYAEWGHASFQNDPSLLYFITHLHQLDGGPVKYIMLGLGTACAYWFGQGR